LHSYRNRTISKGKNGKSQSLAMNMIMTMVLPMMWMLWMMLLLLQMQLLPLLLLLLLLLQLRMRMSAKVTISKQINSCCWLKRAAQMVEGVAVPSFSPQANKSRSDPRLDSTPLDSTLFSPAVKMQWGLTSIVLLKKRKNRTIRHAYIYVHTKKCSNYFLTRSHSNAFCTFTCLHLKKYLLSKAKKVC